MNEILLHCLLVAAQKSGVLMRGFCFMSNHDHLTATDPYARPSELVQHFNTRTSTAIDAPAAERLGVRDGTTRRHW